MTDIAKARPGSIENHSLQLLRDLAYQARDKRNISHAEADMLMLCIPACLDELIQSREVLANLGVTIDHERHQLQDHNGNVIHFPTSTDP